MKYGAVLAIGRLLEKHKKRAAFHWADYCKTQFEDDPEALGEAMGTWASEAFQVVGLLEALHVVTEGAAAEYHDFVVERLAMHQAKSSDKR